MKTLTPRQHHSDSCFEATLEVASVTVDAVVIHGWLHNRENWILHAWCEVDEWVIDLTETREPIDKSTYYITMDVTPERSIRYNRQEFFALGGAPQRTGGNGESCVRPRFPSKKHSSRRLDCGGWRRD